VPRPGNPVEGVLTRSHPDDRPGHPRVLVSILHYNAPANAVETVRCFQAQTFAPFELEIIDNDSLPGALDELQRRLPEVRFRVMTENLGYTGGNNQALIRAHQEGFDYVIVSNDDIEIDPASIARLVETAQSHPDAGVVGGIEVVHQTGEIRVATAEGCSLWAGRIRWRRQVDLSRGPAVESDYVQGALVMFTRAALEKGVRFDTNYFMYYDEVDIGFALKRVGLKAYVDQRVMVRHKNNPLSFHPRSGYLHTRNRLYLVSKHGRWYHRLCFFCYAGLVELPVKVVVRTAQGHGRFARACVVGLLDGLAGRMGRGKASDV
jgi:GT2 family glycosyltransferase